MSYLELHIKQLIQAEQQLMKGFNFWIFKKINVTLLKHDITGLLCVLKIWHCVYWSQCQGCVYIKFILKDLISHQYKMMWRLPCFYCDNLLKVILNEQLLNGILPFKFKVWLMLNANECLYSDWLYRIMASWSVRFYKLYSIFFGIH